MKSIKLTIIYFIAFLFGGLFFSFFAFPARAEACEVDLSDGALRFRTANGVVNQPLLNWFEEDQQKYVYLDIKTYGSDCTETDVFYLTIFGIDEDGDIKKSVENYAIPAITVQQNNGSSIAMIPTEKPCFGDNSDNSTVDCLIFAMITDTPTNNPQVNILGMVGNLISLISPQQAQTFINQFGISGLSPNPTCDSSSGYLYATSVNCVLTAARAFSGLVAGNTPQKLINYYNSYGGSYILINPQISVSGSSIATASLLSLFHPLGGLAVLFNPDVAFELEEGAPPFHTIALPGLLYGCDGICDLSSDNWTVSNNLLPYGGSHSNDQGAIAASPLSDIYQEDYIPLAPLPFEGLSGGPTPELGEYLAAIFRMAIVVTVILAVVMIVFHGIGYALTDVIGKKTDHKDGVKNAILGLVLALGSWLILNTVSPRLASQLRIGLQNVSLDGYEYSEPGIAVIPSGCPKPGTLPASCPACVPIAASVAVKPQLSSQNRNITSAMNPKLQALQQTLSQNNINWQVTEAFQNTVNHCSVCHYRGTCVDANFTSGTQPTVANIQAFISAASSAGLRAVYETNNQTFYQTLKNAGIPLSSGGQGNLLYLQGITAPHFSVYNQ